MAVLVLTVWQSLLVVGGQNGRSSAHRVAVTLGCGRAEWPF